MNPSFRPRRPLKPLRTSRSQSSSPENKKASSTSVSPSSPTRIRRISPRRREIPKRTREESPRRRASSPRKDSPRRRNMSPRKSDISPRRRDTSPRRRDISPKGRSRFRSFSSRLRRNRSRSLDLDDSRRRRSHDREKDKSPGIIDVSTRRNLNDGERLRGEVPEGGRPRFHGAEKDHQLTREQLKATVVTVDCRRSVAAETHTTSRNYVNPQDIVIVRRPGEGIKPLFDREELKMAGSTDERRVISRSPTSREGDGSRRRDRDRSRPREDRFRRDFRYPVRRRSRTRSRSRGRRSKSNSPGRRRRIPTPERGVRRSRDRDDSFEMVPVMPVGASLRHVRPYPVPMVPYIRRPYPLGRPRGPFPRFIAPIPRVPMFHYYPPRMYPPPYRMP